jgi:hypothetical protein
MAHPAQADTSSRIRGTLPCISCGYDLNTRTLDSRCPECGAAIGDSLQSLFLTSPASIHVMRSGLMRVIVAAPLGVAAYITAALISPRNEFVSMWLLLGVMASGPWLAWTGLRRFTLSAGASAPPHSASRRIVLAAMLYAFLMTLTVVLVGSAFGTGSDWPSFIIAIVAGEVWCWRNLGTLTFIRTIARQSNAPRLGAAARWLRWWLMVVAAVFAIFFAARVFRDVLPGNLWQRLYYGIMLGWGLLLIVGGWIVVWPALLIWLWTHLRKVEQRTRRDPPAITTLPHP